jgi:hypothetical protein
MDPWVVKYASRRSRIGDFSGDSSVRCARIRGVLASHASAGQRGLSAQGVEPDGKGWIKGARLDYFVIEWVHASPTTRSLDVPLHTLKAVKGARLPHH